MYDVGPILLQTDFRQVMNTFQIAAFFHHVMSGGTILNSLELWAVLRVLIGNGRSKHPELPDVRRRNAF
jgi:hypothetical protein